MVTTTPILLKKNLTLGFASLFFSYNVLYQNLVPAFLLQRIRIEKDQQWWCTSCAFFFFLYFLFCNGQLQKNGISGSVKRFLHFYPCDLCLSSFLMAYPSMFSLSSLLLYLHQFQKSYLMRLQHQKTPQRKHFEGTKHSKTQIDSISFLPIVSMYWFDFHTHRSSTCCKHFQASLQAPFVGKNKKLFAQVSSESIKWWSSQELSTHRFPWKGSMVKAHMKGPACNKYIFLGLLGGKDDQWWSWSLMQQVRWIHTCMSRKAKRKENRVLELQHNY